MNEVTLKLSDKNHGGFYIMDGDEQLAEMEVSIAGNVLTAQHTEVSEKAAGKGLGKKLISAMVDHARKNKLKVTALCPFVHAQFIRHPAEYSDVWEQRKP